MDEEPLPQWLNSVFKRADDLVVAMNNPAYRFMNKHDICEGLGIDADDIRLMAQIATRLQLVASNIDSRQPTGPRLVKHG